MKQIVLAALFGLGGSILGFFGLAIYLVIFKPFYGPLIFSVFEVAWIVYALFRLVRGLLDIRNPNVEPRAKSDFALSVFALGPIIADFFLR